MTKTKEPLITRPEIQKDRILMHTKDGKQELFLSDDFIYLEADGDFTTVVTTKGSFYKTGRIGKILEKLGLPTLYRCHKSFAINLKRIEGRKYDCALINGKEIPVAKKHQKFLFNGLNGGKIL